MSVSNYGENLLLAALPEKPYVKLHTGDPGEEGLLLTAGETTRKQVTFGAASAGVRKSTTAAEWTNVSTSETYKYVSLWDATSGGNCLWIIPLEAEKAVSAGDSFTLKAEQLSVSLD
jgi:hypothetical protein